MALSRAMAWHLINLSVLVENAGITLPEMGGGREGGDLHVLSQTMVFSDTQKPDQEKHRAVCKHWLILFLDWHFSNLTTMS